MMKILIVDDEYFARKAILQMVADWSSDASLMEAEDGVAALELIEQHTPDIIITDIRMPGLDGIALAKFVHDNQIGAAVIIISGFDDFHYAREAIRYRVENYLLKPVDRSELYPQLNELKDKYSAAEKKQLNALIACSLFDEDTKKINEEISTLLNLDEETDYSRTIVLWLSPEHHALAVSSLRGFIGPRFKHAAALSDRQSPHLLALWLCGREKDLHYESIRILCDTVSMQMQQELKYSKYTVHSGTSSLQKGSKDIYESCKAAKLASLQALLSHEIKTINHTSIHTSYLYDAAFLNDWTQSFQRKLTNLQEDEAIAMLDSWSEQSLAKQFSAYMQQDWFAATVQIMNTIIGHTNKEVEASFIEQQSLFDYFSAEAHLNQLKGWTRGICGLLKKKEAKTGLIENIKHDVELHFATKITLEELAKNKYFVDPSYLSRQFKKKSGVSFTSYLLSVRMEKAKDLLENGEAQSISEAASRVGFNDDSYFIQMYKKYYGETPGKTIHSK